MRNDYPAYDLIKSMSDSNRRAENGDDALLYANFFIAAAHFIIHKRSEYGKPLTVEEMLAWFDLDKFGDAYLKEDHHL